MATGDNYVISRGRLLDLTRDYFDSIGVAQAVDKVIAYFFETQIFGDFGDDRVGFRYTIFFSFFLAKAMVSSAQTRSFIISEDNCVRYLSEIDIYFGIARGDIDSLRDLSNFHSVADRNLNACLREAGLSVDNNFVESLRLARDPDTDKIVADAVAQVGNSSAISADSRDRHLANPMEERIGLIQQMKRPKFSDAVARWVLTLRAYSVAIKNLELIPVAEKKKHLATVLTSWSKAVAGSVVITQGLARDGYVAIGPVTIYVDEGTKEAMQGPALRAFYLMAPESVAEYMRRDLGSPKLARMLEDDGVVGDGLLQLFLQKVLGSDLRVANYLDGLSRLIRRLTGSPFLQESLLWHLWRLHMRRSLAGPEEEKFARLVAELYADSLGLSGAKRKEEVAKMLQRARRDKLIIKVQDGDGAGSKRS